MKRINQAHSGKKLRIFSLGLLAFLAVFFVVQTVSAGPITNPGGAPFVKVGAYQGVISIVPPNGSAVMELGNAGSDIASSADIYIRPDAIAHDSALAAYFYNNGGKAGFNLTGQANLGYVNILAQGGINEGGELTFQPAPGYTQWYIDSYQNRLRFYRAGLEYLTISNTTGNTYIMNGQLCFGPVGSADCKNTWGGAGGTPTLDQVLATGNTGTTKVILLNSQAANAKSLGVTSGASLGSGSFAFLAAQAAADGSYSDVTRASDSGLFFNQATGLTISGWNATGTIKGIRVTGGTAANAALTVNNGLAGVGSAGDGISTFANTTGSALYAQQNNSTGYAGYFSGSSIFKGPAGGTDVSSNPIYGTLSVYNNSAGAYGTGIYAVGGNVFNGQGVNGSVGVLGVGARTVANGQFSYGVYGTTGGNTGAAATAKTYGGFFSIDSGSWVGTNYGIYAKAGSTVGGTHYAGYFEDPYTFPGIENYAGMFKGRVYQQGNQFTPTKSLPLTALAYVTATSTCQTACHDAGLECYGGISPQPGNLKVVSCTETVTSTACFCAQFAW